VRTVHVETILPTDADRVWPAMLSPVTFLYVCRGLLSVPALSGRSEALRAGERGTGWLFAFHVIPAYRHTIEIVEVDQATKTLRTHEHGGILKAWDHTLHVEPIDDRSSRYCDTVDIDAGVATVFVAALAMGIYRYRQRRWRKLVRQHMMPHGTAYAS
jgi:O-succinylbenzoate synthase